MLKAIRIEHVFTKKLLFYHQDMGIQNKIVKLSLNAYPLPPLWCKNEDMQNIIQTPLSHFHSQGSRLGRVFRSFERPNRRLILEKEN